MPLPTLYLESSIPSYLAARPSRDLVTAAHQQRTHQWWDLHRGEYTLFVSELVLTEICRGDSQAAQRRISIVNGLPRLQISEKVKVLSEAYVETVPRLKHAGADAIHLALASVNQIDLVLSWNCRHIANESVRDTLRAVNEKFGMSTPHLCTPEELLDDDDTLD